MKLIDITGKQFGRLTVISRAEKSKHTLWVVVCDCGTKKSVCGLSLRKGATKSCGCLRKDMGAWNKGIVGSASHSFHGHGEVPLSWFNETKTKAISRGKSWSLTIDFLNDLYVRQEKKCAISKQEIVMPSYAIQYSNVASLDRIDSKQGYEVGNVQWVDRRVNFMKQQQSQEDFIAMCKVVARAND